MTYALRTPWIAYRTLVGGSRIGDINPHAIKNFSEFTPIMPDYPEVSRKIKLLINTST
jgi:hypothetical protein